MKKIKIFLIIIIILVGCFGLYKFILNGNQSKNIYGDLPPEEPEPINITAEVIGVIPFGDDEKELGFKWVNKESGICVYPIAFDVDLEKNFYFIDNLKERIVIYNKDFQFIDSIYIGDKKLEDNAYFCDIAVGLDNTIYVSYPPGKSILVINPKTKEIKIVKNEDTVGIGELHLDKNNNNLYFLNRGHYTKFDKDLNSIGYFYSPIFDTEGNNYRIEMVNEGQYGGPLKLSKINKEGVIEKSVLLKKGESLYISQFLGVDKNDLIYLAIIGDEEYKLNLLNEENKGSYFCKYYIYNNNLEIQKIVNVEYKDYYKKRIPAGIFSFHFERLTIDGEIYHFTITTDGVEIAKFKP